MKSYNQFLEEGIEQIKVHLLDGTTVVNLDSLVGYCFYPVHKGYVTKIMLKEHDCINKHCPFLNKFLDFPYWTHLQEENNAKEIHRQERALSRKMQSIDKEILEKIKTLAQMTADEKDYSIIVTSVSKTGRKHYTINYVSDNARSDWNQYYSIVDDIKAHINARFYLKHIKKANGRYATIDDYISAKGR